MDDKTIQESAYFLTKKLIDAISQEVMDENILSSMCEQLGVRDMEAKIFFYTQLMLTLRKYPDSLFSTDDVRTEFLHIIQENLDQLILEESFE